MEIRIAEKMASRPCKFSLAFQDDCVFADFDVDKKNCIYLVRISFDGYGCCRPSWDGKTKSMNIQDSKTLLNKVENGSIDFDSLNHILKSYFDKCKKALWVDALIEYGLI